jgi:membrane protein implicated in regulation of membrane protease activity
MKLTELAAGCNYSGACKVWHGPWWVPFIFFVVVVGVIAYSWWRKRGLGRRRQR